MAEYPLKRLVVLDGGVRPPEVDHDKTLAVLIPSSEIATLQIGIFGAYV